MQEIRRFKPSTVSRRFSMVAGSYRTCVIDGLLEHSPAEHVRAARESPDTCGFALVAMLGLLGLRTFEATGADIADLGEEHGHRVLRVCGKGTKAVPIPLPPAAGRSTDRATGTRTPDRSCSTAAAPAWTATPPPSACGDSPRQRGPGSPGHIRTCSGTLERPQFRRGRGSADAQIAGRHADPRTTMRYGRARKNLDRHPNYILAAHMASGT